MANSDPRFPLVYQSTWYTKAAVVTFAAALSVALILLPESIPLSTITDKIVVAVFLIFGVDAVLATLMRRLSLYPDRFEYRWELGSYQGRKSDIRGYRAISSRYGDHLRFYINTPPGRSFEIRDVRSTDPFLKGWLSDVTDLNAAEQAAFAAALRENQAFGRNYAERDASISRHKIIATIFNFACILLTVWLLFPYSPMAVQVASAAAIGCAMVLAILSRGRYALLWDIQNPKLKLTCAFAPGLILGGRIFMDQGLLDKEGLMPAALVSAAVMALLVAWIDGRIQLKSIGLAGLALAIWGYGSLAIINRYADQKPGVLYHATVTDKTILYGSRGGNSYKLNIAPIAVSQIPTRLDTNAVFYDQTKPGDTVCVTIHSGALNYRWFDWGACPPTHAASART